MVASHLTFILKTSFDCNFGCFYCSEGQRDNSKHLNIASLDTMFENIGAYARETSSSVTFLWQGGEPLIRGIDYYRHIVHDQKRLGIDKICSNWVQTNGLLLDKAFASFLCDNDFVVGISLDGPQIIHDAQRPTKSGKPSFHSVCEAISNIRECGRDVGVVSVFTRKSLEHIDEYYDFFHRNMLSVRMNPLLDIGDAHNNSSLQLTPKEYGEALVYIYDKWISEPGLTVPFEPFYGIVRSLYTGQFNCCFLLGKCQNYFEVFPNGDLYLCGNQHGARGAIGNVCRDDFQLLMNSPRRKAYAEEKASVREICGDCRHFDICHGGCTTSALAQQPNGKIGRDYFCESYKMLFDHIKKTMAKSLPAASKHLIASFSVE